jgi:hypothetical protein
MPFLFWLLGLGGLFTATVALKKKAEPTPKLPVYLPAYVPMVAPPKPAITVPKEIKEKFDTGLAPAEITAVVYALAKEQDWKKLREFADLFAPEFPIVVARLRTQAELIKPVYMKLDVQSPKASSRLSSRLVSTKFGQELWSTFFVPPGVRPIYRHSSEWGEKEKALDRENKMIESIYANTRIKVSRYTWGIGGPSDKLPVFEMSLGDALKTLYYEEEGRKNEQLRKKSFFEKIFSFVGKAIKTVGELYLKGLKIVAPILSYVPGVGSVAASLITAGASLALGDPIDKAFLEGVKASVPGQPMSGMAIQAGFDIVKGIQEGKRFDAIMLGAARDAALSKIPGGAAAKEAAKIAIDTGIALAQGQDLQQAGFSTLRNLAKGNTMVEQAIDFASKLVEAQKANKPVEEVLMTSLATDLSKIDYKGLPRVIDEITKNPKLMNLSPDKLASAQGVPEPVARAALGSLKVLPIPKWMLDKLGLPPITYPDPGVLRRLQSELESMERARKHGEQVKKVAIAREKQRAIEAKKQKRTEWVKKYVAAAEALKREKAAEGMG